MPEESVNYCQFCGSKQIVTEPYNLAWCSDEHTFWQMTCKECGAKGPKGETKSEALEYFRKWKKGEAYRQLQKQIEQLKKLLRYAYELPMHEAGDYSENCEWKDKCEQALQEKKG